MMLVSEVNYDSLDGVALQEYPEHIKLWIEEFYIPSVKYVDSLTPSQLFYETMDLVSMSNIYLLRNSIEPHRIKDLWNLLFNHHMIILFSKDRVFAQLVRYRLLQFATFRIRSSNKMKKYVYAMCGEDIKNLRLTSTM